MAEKTAKEPEAVEKLVLTSPSGHKYAITVTDSGNLEVTLQEVAKHADTDAGRG